MPSYIVFPGNNGDVIEKTLQRRSDWHECASQSSDDDDDEPRSAPGPTWPASADSRPVSCAQAPDGTGAPALGERARVVGELGVIVRSSANCQSARVGHLSAGSVISIGATTLLFRGIPSREKLRVQITEPVAGWVSAVSSTGEKLLKRAHKREQPMISGGGGLAAPAARRAPRSRAPRPSGRGSRGDGPTYNGSSSDETGSEASGTTSGSTNSDSDSDADDKDEDGKRETYRRHIDSSDTLHVSGRSDAFSGCKSPAPSRAAASSPASTTLLEKRQHMSRLNAMLARQRFDFCWRHTLCAIDNSGLRRSLYVYGTTRNSSHSRMRGTSSSHAAAGPSGRCSSQSLVNHFPELLSLCTKDGLLRSLSAYYSSQGLDVFDFTPTTFVVPNFPEEVHSVGAVRGSRRRASSSLSSSTLPSVARRMRRQKKDRAASAMNCNAQPDGEAAATSPGPFDRGAMRTAASPPAKAFTLSSQANATMATCDMAAADWQAFCTRWNDFARGNYAHERLQPKHCQKNLWLVKPTNMNQGEGIEVVSDFGDVVRCCSQEKARARSIGQAGRAAPGGAVWVVQKYLECPLLITGRKFDIRAWVLVTDQFDVYWYREGYLRTSSEAFVTDVADEGGKSGGDEKVSESERMRMIHLTNYCMQKHSDNLGKFEEGNTLSFNQFQRYIDEHHGERGVSVREDLVPRMQNMVVDSIMATRSHLNRGNRKQRCFELFGYDFMVDEDFRSYLIEVNTNPFLGFQNDWHRGVVESMVEDMLQLTVDRFFGGASAGTLGGEPPVGSGWQLLKSDSAGLDGHRQIDRTDFYPSGDTVPAPEGKRFCEGKE